MPAQLLRDRIVVVTGGGRGLGRAFAEACCVAGATVVVADIDAQTGAAATEALAADGHRASFVYTDIAAPDSVAALAEVLRSPRHQALKPWRRPTNRVDSPWTSWRLPTV